VQGFDIGDFHTPNVEKTAGLGSWSVEIVCSTF